MKLTLIALASSLLGQSIMAQSSWSVPHIERPPQMDGRLDDWSAIEPIVLSPSHGPGRAKGEFNGASDLRLEVRAAWSSKGLHVGLLWQDDIWDVRRIARKDSIWVSPTEKRRNVMYFHDNLKFHLFRPNFNYLVWVSPRSSGKGPFHWTRAFGKKGLELASSPPLISTTVAQDGSVTMEWLFRWKDWPLKGKSYKDLRFSLEIADSDWPQQPPESKESRLKSLQWAGSMLLSKKR